MRVAVATTLKHWLLSPTNPLPPTIPVSIVVARFEGPSNTTVVANHVPSSVNGSIGAHTPVAPSVRTSGNTRDQPPETTSPLGQLLQVRELFHRWIPLVGL